MLETLLLLTAVVAAAAWWYNRWRHSYWTSLGIPTVPTIPFIGNICDAFTKLNMWHAIDDEYKYHGGSKFVGRYECFRPVLLVGDLDILKQILIKDFDHFTDRRIFGGDSEGYFSCMMSNINGEKWKTLRSIMSPTFSSGKIKKMFSIVCEKGDMLVSSCLKDAVIKPSLDMKDKFGRFTMDTIASCAFGIDCNSFDKEKPEFTQKAEVFFSSSPLKMFFFFFLLLFPYVFKAIGLKSEPPEMLFFEKVVLEALKSRKSDHQRGDFLDLMIEAQVGDADKPSSAKQVLSEKFVVAQCILFLIAGYDTAASTLAFASHLLAQNPEEQQRLRDELKELVQQNGELTYQGVMEAKLLDACIMETMRLYPPGAVGERMCSKPFKLPGTEVILPPGLLVQIPIYSLHRDPRYWPDPEKFQPDRFLPENKANITNFSHMPFGMGPRNCIAMRFALMEVKVAIAKLILEAEVQLVPGHEEIITEKYTFLLRPQDGMQLLIKPLMEE